MKGEVRNEVRLVLSAFEGCFCCSFEKVVHGGRFEFFEDFCLLGTLLPVDMWIFNSLLPIIGLARWRSSSSARRILLCYP